MGESHPAPQFGAEWLAQLRAGDEGAFEALFRAFTPGLVALVTRYVRSRQVAEELVQEMFLALWHRRLTLDVQHGVSTYLYAAARNRALAHIRHERIAERHATGVLARIEEPASAGDDDLLAALELQDAIAQLPTRTRLVYTLSRERGMTNAEIGVCLDISIKTVEAQMSRALRILRQRLRHLYP